MKKKIALFMAVVCLVICCMDVPVLAAEYKFCPYCGSTLSERGQHMDHWYTYRTFKDNYGAQVTCTEFHSVDRISKVCTNGCGVVKTDDVETVTHSLSECPYK